MQTIDTLLQARWIIPVEPENQTLEDYALAIRDGRLVDILPAQQAQTKYTPIEHLKLPSHVLIPGLVNAHGHAAMTLLRGLSDDLPLMEWLNKHIWPAEARWISAEFVHDGTQLAMAEMLRGGITCFNDMYFFSEVIADAARDCGMRACVGLITVEFPSAWAANADEYLEKGLALHDTLRHDPLIHSAFAPHAPYTVSEASLARIRVLADQLDVPIHIHVHETAGEVEQSIQQQGCRPLALLDKLGLISPNLIAVHMTQLQTDEIARIAEAGASVVHCPESNLKLASGFCPVAQLLEAGVNVALGTDGAASNNDLDLFGEMRTAALIAKAVSGDASALPAHQVLRMATRNGAQALGLEADIGTLEPGKWADITAVDLGTLESTPVYHPQSQLIYATARHHVTHVWVAGRALLQDRRLTTLNSADIQQRAQSWQKKIGDFDQQTKAT